MIQVSPTARREATGRQPIRVMCVDDNPLIADALAAKLNVAGGFEWVGHLLNATMLVRDAARLKPDVVLMDLDMPGPEPFEAMRRLARSQPAIRVLILSGHVRRELLDRAVESGAWGYLSKNDDAEDVVEAIRRVAAGEFVIGASVAAEA